MSVNRVIITGNLGADPELKRTQSGTAVMSMRVAVNDRRKNQQTGAWEDYCNWVGVTMFGSRAESVANYLHRGSKVGIDGKLRYSEWQTNDGQKRNKLEVIADDIELLSPKDGQNGSHGGGYQQQGGYNGGYQNAPQNRSQGYQQPSPQQQWSDAQYAQSQAGQQVVQTVQNVQMPQIEPQSSVYDDDCPF